MTKLKEQKKKYKAKKKVNIREKIEKIKKKKQ